MRRELPRRPARRPAPRQRRVGQRRRRRRTPAAAAAARRRRGASTSAAPRVRRAHQRRRDRRLVRVEAARVLAEQRARQRRRCRPISPRNGTRFRYASRICVLAPAPLQLARRQRSGRASARRCGRRPAAPARRRAGRPAASSASTRRACAWFHRLPQALPASAAQSTPPCSQKRRSSLSTSAVRSAGDTSASAIHGPRRACSRCARPAAARRGGRARRCRTADARRAPRRSPVRRRPGHCRTPAPARRRQGAGRTAPSRPTPAAPPALRRDGSPGALPIGREPARTPAPRSRGFRFSPTGG